MKKLSFVIIIVIIVLISGVFLPKDFGYQESTIFRVERGDGSSDIARNLKEQELIRFGGLFRLYALSTGISLNLQAGEYELSSSMNVHQIARMLVKGDIAKETITIIEGWSLRDIAKYLESRGIFQKKELFEISGFPVIDYRIASNLPFPKDFSNEYEFLKEKPVYLSLEGYLFPDTYFVQKGIGVEGLIRLMLDNFEDKTKDLSLDYNTLIVASLLEKEVISFEDKRIVAGIIQKRLDNGIALQVDATVTYVTGENNGRVLIKDTKVDSLFNTYKYPGLPLGPISNPGFQSIEAALNPQKSSYLYYLSTPEGETIFSETLEEHNEAKAKYLK